MRASGRVVQRTGRQTGRCLVAAAGVVLLPACVFNTGGVADVGSSPPDRSVDRVFDGPRLDVADAASDGDLAVDLAGDLAVDVGIDAHPACQTPASGRVCLGESPGQVGACEGGALTALRHCFAEAPCRDGFCDPQAGGGCISCSGCNAGDELCTLFDTPQKQPETCCVTASPSNGGGDHATSCVTGEVCRSGLCTTEGFCFEACGSFHACALSTCGVVQVVVHEVPVNRTGCRPLQPDGDVAPGDGPRDGTGEAAPGDGSRDGTGEAAPGDGTGDGTGDAVPGDDLAGDLASDAGSAEQQASEAGGNG